MNYEKKTKGELISELKSLKSKLEDLENKKSEGKLNKTVSLMTNVINSTTDLISVKDMKLRTIMCNKAFANAAGKKPEEMIGKTDIENGWDPELVNGNPEKGIPGFGNDDRQALKGNEIHRPMEPGNVGNEIRFFDTRKLPLRDADGQIFGILGISRDITERVQVEDELKKLFDLSLDMICIADITTSYFKRINPAFGKTLGYSDEELLGRPFTDFVHPDDRNPTIKVVEGMRSRGSDVINFENRYRCKDGSYKWLMWTSKAIPEQGVAYAVARDITEKKLVEEELKRHRNQLKELVTERTIELATTNKKLQFEIAERKQSDERLQAIIDNSTAVIYIKDIKGHYIMINRLYETLLNISKKGIIGKTDFDIFPEELAETFQKNDRKVLKFESPFEFEEMALHADGLHTYISLKFPLSNTEGVIYGVCGISTDITERKKSEERITSMAQIFEDSLNEIYIFDAKTLRLIQVNKTARLNLGYSAEELSRFTPLDLKPEFTSESFEKLIEPLVTGKKKKIQITTVHRRKDNSLYDVEVHLQLSTFQSKPAFVAIILDITDRRKMEKELIKVQKLESIGVFAGGIAHDFNNGLQTILGYISLAKLRTKPNDEIHGFLEEAGKAVLQSKDLTHQLLTFAKGGTPVKQTISIAELLGGATRLALGGSKAKCELIVPDGLWHIEADKGQLNQVISNLIINANQAMPEGGNIKILAENINVSEKDLLPLQKGSYVKITVEDHGTGISQEHLQSIFDPYFTTKQEGSGLGLATAYSIVKRHDGHITVESETGAGTTFHIYLPASQKEIPKEPVTRRVGELDNKYLEKKDAGKPAVSKGRILVMDDEYTIRNILCKRLSVLKYEAEAVGEGSEVIRLYKDACKAGKPFDAVLMDLTVPGGMGGKETIKKLLEIDPAVSAIVSSGYTNDPIIVNHLKYGFKGALVKPYEIHELDETLQKVIKMIK